MCDVCGKHPAIDNSQREPYHKNKDGLYFVGLIRKYNQNGVRTIEADLCKKCETAFFEKYNGIGQNSAVLIKALQSIANNKCCDTCQEAALVAKKALSTLPFTPCPNCGGMGMPVKKGVLYCDECDREYGEHNSTKVSTDEKVNE